MLLTRASDGYRQPIVSQENVLGKSWLHIGMFAKVVADVSEICSFGVDFAYNFKSLGNVHVAGVAVNAQGIDHKRVNTAHELNCLIGHSFAVGDVGESANAIAENWQPGMHHGQGNDCVVANGERSVVIKLVEIERWHAGVEIFAKAIRNAVA